MLNDPVVIVGAARTPMGGFQGDFSPLTASDLGAAAIKAAIERAGIRPDDVDEVIMGNVLPAGQGQAPARQASLKAGVPLGAGCTTVNKMCGSAMKAAMLAHDLIVAGSADIVVAGGMESMTNAPYLMPKARGGYRMGHQTVQDHMFLDGLEDAYEKGRLMGTFAEDCAGSFGFTREAQDAFALTSLSRALAANNDGTFAWEVAPVTVAGRKGRRRHRQGRAAGEGVAGEGAAAEACVPQGRHGDRRKLELDLRRRGSPRADAPVHRREAQARAPRGDRRACDACAGAGPLHDGAGRRDREALPEDGLDDEGCRSLRDQRGVRRRDDGGDEGARDRARQGQRARRRLRARPSHRRFGCANRRHAARRFAQARQEARRRRPFASAAARRPRWRSSCSDLSPRHAP
jgi:acetyl-CoA C-acetyltransferase